MMYSKKDYMDYFLNIEDLSSLTHNQIIELFQTCIKYDSFKLALQLYFKYLRAQDINKDIMYRLTLSIRESCTFLEIKLFFIHENFDELGVEAMNFLIDVLLQVVKRHNYHLNPIISSYNTIKVSLLIFKVTFRVEQLNIYSLITKCQLLNKYMEDSLTEYLQMQTNIGQLYKFMMEPILNLKHK